MQAEVTRILEASKIPFELIDIASGETLLEEMRSKTSNPTALPPQIFNNDVYCGCIKAWLKEQSTCPTCRVHALLPEDFPVLPGRRRLVNASASSSS
ncbi:SH3 domain-binding glutamic acid-rich-like protein 3 [Acipenser ruthenus]|uniref:SH3 domain-binding glutamic acid-rich-like protein 3 n=1 Tax=Acipenser ruthenus TaxID=7906 RepID=A0A444V1F1_ACIRT|nr:SH3 domain-binding glutamic acid-rich-like protein 3 [Acipenser ruthenus]